MVIDEADVKKCQAEAAESGQKPAEQPAQGKAPEGTK